jgi:hypothetical protein
MKQSELTIAAHMGTLQARNSNFVFRALKVSFTEAEKKQYQGIEEKVNVAMCLKEGDCLKV